MSRKGKGRRGRLSEADRSIDRQSDGRTDGERDKLTNRSSAETLMAAMMMKTD